MTPSKETIESHFRDNVERIDHLLNQYDQLTPDSSGRRPVAAQDLLRSAVVFLHASLEDAVRTLALWKLPLADRDALKSVGLPGLKSNQFHLGHLTYHRGKTVDELLEESVESYLDASNFNEPSEVKDMLEHCGLDSSFVENFEADLQPMMKRRHWIVHRMDRNYSGGSGQHSARSISQSTVVTWKETVCEVVDQILEQV